MPSLLNPSDFALINNAIRDVTDTFATSPIILRKYNADNVTDSPPLRFNELGNKIDDSNNYYDDYTLDAFVEHDEKEMDFNHVGGVQKRSIKVLLNFDYLNENNLIDNSGKSIISNDRDEIIWKNQVYRITDVQPDGLLNEKFSIVMIYAQQQDYSNR